MAKLERLQDVIYFGDTAMTVVEQPHKKTKEFLKLFTQTIAEANNVAFSSDQFPKILETILLEKPYEALQIFVPGLTVDQFEEATNRELIYAFKTVLRINGIELDKILKNLKPLVAPITN